jgi:GNAT superfamily N-acetyltransferase
MRIRPLQPEDVPRAREIGAATLPAPPAVDQLVRTRFSLARWARFLEADAEGAWAAEDDEGRMIGCALALVRDGIWGLSYLAVDPGAQGRGVGRGLLDATLAHGGDGVRGAIIQSSTDPRAMRLYATAGFDVLPCLAAAGIADRGAIPAGLRSSEAGDDALELGVALGREVRGGAYDPEDLRTLLDSGFPLLRCGDDGIAFHVTGHPALLVARDDETAADLLWSCMAAAPRGGTVVVDALGPGQDWAVRACLAARLALSPDAPIFVRGELGPLRPWLCNGAYL